MWYSKAEPVWDEEPEDAPELSEEACVPIHRA